MTPTRLYDAARDGDGDGWTSNLIDALQVTQIVVSPTQGGELPFYCAVITTNGPGTRRNFATVEEAEAMRDLWRDRVEAAH
jgi:hypothetical protein